MRFTLIELLVVMAVIAILAGLTVAAAGKARERSRQAECVGQLHQIGIAIHGYLGENDDRLPCCARLGPDPMWRMPSLRQCLDGSLDTQRVFRCPADPPPKGLFDDVGTSYEWNTLVSGRRVQQPALTIIGMQIDAPIMGDADDFHGKRGRNALFPDGRVVTAPEIQVK